MEEMQVIERKGFIVVKYDWRATRRAAQERRAEFDRFLYARD